MKEISIKKTIIKFFVAILVAVLCIAISELGFLVYMSGYDYDMFVAQFYYDCDWVIGKTIDEVVEKYGMFDDYGKYLHSYYNDSKQERVEIADTYQTGRYYINDTRFSHGLEGRNYGCIFTIIFDENGIAVESDYSRDSEKIREYRL